MKTRIVLDTNIVVSGLMKFTGNEAEVLDLAIAGEIQLCFSQAILLEYVDVLHRHYLRLDFERVDNALNNIQWFGLRVSPRQQLHISPDPSDNRFLECAEAARAEYLVTGNKRHFPERHGVTAIVNAREFLDQLYSR